MFFHYSEYPLSLRTLYTFTLIVLGIGYLFAMLHVFNSHAGRDGKPGLSVKDLEIAYSGSKADTRLEVAIKGPMIDRLSNDERNIIIAWVRSGAKEKPFNENIKPIIEDNCLACHDGSNPHLPNLDGFDNVKKVVKLDTGADIFSLIRVSHIHLFGITFIFFIMGSMFSHALVRPVWFKSLVIAVPFVTIILDIGSWYLTKIYPPFAWVVMISGGFMGLSFAFMWFTCIYQMWFYKLPKDFSHES